MQVTHVSNLWKKTALRVLLVGAAAAPLAMTGCYSDDIAAGTVAAAIDIGDVALGDAYYAGSCFNYYSDYYCDDGWDGWYGSPYYDGGGYGRGGYRDGYRRGYRGGFHRGFGHRGGFRGGHGGFRGGHGGFGHGRRLETASTDMTAQATRHAHIANAQVIAGGLMLRYHLPERTAVNLGRAFAAARQKQLAPIYKAGFTQDDFSTFGHLQPLSNDRLQALASRLHTSPRMVSVLVRDLERSYQAHR